MRIALSIVTFFAFQGVAWARLQTDLLHPTMEAETTLPSCYAKLHKVRIYSTGRSDSSLGFAVSPRVAAQVVSSNTRELDEIIEMRRQSQNENWKLRSADGKLIPPSFGSGGYRNGKHVVGLLEFKLPTIPDANAGLDVTTFSGQVLIVPFEGTIERIENREFNVLGGTYARTYKALVINTRDYVKVPYLGYYSPVDLIKVDVDWTKKLEIPFIPIPEHTADTFDQAFKSVINSSYEIPTARGYRGLRVLRLYER